MIALLFIGFLIFLVAYISSIFEDANRDNITKNFKKK